MLNTCGLVPESVLRADTQLLLGFLASIDFSMVWFCKSYTFTKEICNSARHVCITRYLLNYLLKKICKDISIWQQLMLSSVEADINTLCRRVDQRLRCPGSHQYSQTSRLPCLPGDTGFFVPDKTTKHYSLPSKMTPRNDIGIFKAGLPLMQWGKW